MLALKGLHVFVYVTRHYIPHHACRNGPSLLKSRTTPRALSKLFEAVRSRLPSLTCSSIVKQSRTRSKAHTSHCSVNMSRTHSAVCPSDRMLCAFVQTLVLNSITSTFCHASITPHSSFRRLLNKTTQYSGDCLINSQ